MSRICRIISPPLLVIAALGLFRLAVGSSQPAETKSLSLQTKPLVIATRYDVPPVATEEQLAAVLRRVLPPAGAANTNKLVHALRLWGADAKFADPAIPSGPVMRAYLLRDDVYRELAGAEAPALFHPTANGVEARPWERRDPQRALASHHTSDLLATLAETRTPLDMPLTMREGEATVGDLLQTALDRYQLDQLEDEWTVISLARYGFPLTSWRNVHGERIDLDMLIRELIDAPLDHGACGGTHRLEALVVICRANEQTQSLSPRTLAAVHEHLAHMAGLLTAAQSSEGFWSRGWQQGEAAADQPAGSLYDRILVTGHHLEWLALAPSEVQPPRETVVRAGQWLAHTMVEVDEAQLADHYGPFSHAARALCLWRGSEAYEMWLHVQPLQP